MTFVLRPDLRGFVVYNDVMTLPRLIYEQTEDMWCADVPDEFSPVASHGDTLISECLSNYDSIQCRLCWWKHTWGTRLHVIYSSTQAHCGLILSGSQTLSCSFDYSQVYDMK